MSKAEKEKNIIRWINEELLPDLVEKNEFKSKSDGNKKIMKIEYENSTEIGTDHFTSNTYFINLVLESDGECRTYRLIVKAASQHEAFREVMFTDIQFYNEAAMYNQVLPTFNEFLTRQKSDLNNVFDLCPNSYYCEFDPDRPERAIIILENLKPFGFVTTESIVFLDYEHCVLALKTLGIFHSISYAMKLRDSEVFNKLKQIFKEVRFPSIPLKIKEANEFFGATSSYAIDYILEKGIEDIPREYLKKIKGKFENSFETLKRLITPREPLAVICHGDFCRNNMLFKYDENKKPINIKLIDFQTFRYASPALDLSFFIYMNTTAELRQTHFKDLLKVYHSSLKDSFCNITNADFPEIYSFKNFEKEFSELSIYGYAIASFFIPMMMAPPSDAVTSGNFEEDFVSRDHLEAIDNIIESVTEESRNRVIDILKHMYQSGYYAD